MKGFLFSTSDYIFGSVVQALKDMHTLLSTEGPIGTGISPTANHFAVIGVTLSELMKKGGKRYPGSTDSKIKLPYLRTFRNFTHGEHGR